MKSLAKLKKIKGDASFREFYRNRENKSIIVISKKEKLKNYKDLCYSEKKIKDGIDVIAIMTPPGSHQEIAELFIKNNIFAHSHYCKKKSNK